MHFPIYLLMFEVPVALVFFLGLALHSTKSVSRLHRRWITATWLSYWFIGLGLSTMMAIVTWDNGHSAITPGHIPWNVDRWLSAASLLTILAGGATTPFFYKKEKAAQVFFEHKRRQKKKNFKTLLASVGIFVPRTWIEDFEWQN